MENPLKNCEAGRGKYRVSFSPHAPIRKIIKIETRDSDGKYIDQLVDIDGVEDLKDLFISIASVLNQIYDTDYFQ